MLTDGQLPGAMDVEALSDDAMRLPKTSSLPFAVQRSEKKGMWPAA